MNLARVLLSTRGVDVPTPYRIKLVPSMTVEANQRVSGPLAADRVQNRLRSASQPAESQSSDKTAATPAALMRRMSPGEFNTAMIHFYRGEVQRSNTWRNR